MPKTFKWLSKAFVSGCIALVVLTLFCFLYYNIPVHSTDASGATDYSWEHKKFYSRGTEGFAWGRTNNEGYLNPVDYSEGMNVDVLIMGSSHMEAYNVAMEDSTASQLSSLLGDEVVYNIGVSGHTFLTCSDNLEAALEKYRPQKYAVIETSALLFPDEDVRKVIEGEAEELESHSGGIIGLLQKNQLLRLLYSQLSNWLEAPDEGSSATVKPEANTELYSELLNKLSKTASEYGVKLIILYQSNMYIDPETGISFGNDTDLRDFFSETCREVGIEFADMSERFAEEYSNSYILPHGFSNTSVGAGHLNKHGHRMIAEELCKIMRGEN